MIPLHAIFIFVKNQALDTPLDQLEILLHNPIHELRMAALLCMVEQFKKADANRREAIYHTYLSNTAYINNWDLVDLSAAQIVGGYLEEQDHTPLYRLAQSSLIWEVGKKDKIRLCTFLDTRYRDMPRTMLRYAIEKFSPEERRHYMQK